MSNTIKVKRGKKENIPKLETGEPAFTIDTNEFFIGGDSGNVQMATNNLVTNEINGLMSADDKIKLDTIDKNANNYILPIASSSILGGIKQGSNITIDDNGIISSNPGIGLNSVAEGQSTVAYGVASHTEGQNTEVYGVASHAEGYNNVVNNNYSHVEGKNVYALLGTFYKILNYDNTNKTLTLNNVANLSVGIEVIMILDNISEPYMIKITNINTTNNKITIQNTDGSPANITHDWYYIVYNYNNKDKSYGLHIEGEYNYAKGTTTHCEGSNNVITGFYNHSEGVCNVNSGNICHLEGEYNYNNNGESSHIENFSNIDYNNCSHVEGYYNANIHGTLYYVVTSDVINKKATLNTVNGLSVGIEVIIAINYDNNYNYGSMPAYITAIDGNTITLDCKSLNDPSQLGTNIFGYIIKPQSDSNNWTTNHVEGSNNYTTGTSDHTEGWNNFNLGVFSHVEGGRCYALDSSWYSHAEGYGNVMYGYYNHAEGLYNLAMNGTIYEITAVDTTNLQITLKDITGLSIGNFVVLMSYSNNLINYATITAITGNVLTIVTNERPKAGWKYLVYCSDDDMNNSWGSQHVQGTCCIANGDFTSAQGFATIASGIYSNSEGYYTRTNGIASHSEGSGTIADNYASHVCGKYNKIMVTGGSDNTQIGDAFVIGNGTSKTTLSNAFRVTFDGSVFGTQAYSASGADYAEYFEWLDENPNNEDRCGYFVTLDNDKIKIATTGDYILGIISANPCIIGNGDEDWQGKYLHDDFGRFIYEDTEEEIIKINKLPDSQFKPKTNEINNINLEVTQTEEDSPMSEFVKTGNIIKSGKLKLNPNYDNTQKYISRSDRPEWDLVGMLGALAVRDDGTCMVNGYCTININGIATACERGNETYRVIKRINNNVIKIIFK